MKNLVNKADGWDHLMSSGFSFKSAQFAFTSAPKAISTSQGSDEKGKGFVIHYWNLGDLEHFASKAE